MATTLRGKEFITESDQMRANKIRVMQVAGKLENRLILGTVAKKSPKYNLCGNLIHPVEGGICMEMIMRKNAPPIMIKHGLTKVGMKKEKLYNIWVSMKQRCNNPKDANYFRYGGRGIKVCEEWNNDYISFKTWCLDNGYKEGLELDRANNDDGYNPMNCRFITHRENLANTHRRIHDVINGEDISLSDAAYKYGLSYKLLYNRYKRGKRGNDLIAHNNSNRA